MIFQWWAQGTHNIYTYKSRYIVDHLIKSLVIFHFFFLSLIRIMCFNACIFAIINFKTGIRLKHFQFIHFMCVCWWSFSIYRSTHEQFWIENSIKVNDNWLYFNRMNERINFSEACVCVRVCLVIKWRELIMIIHWFDYNLVQVYF